MDDVVIVGGGIIVAATSYFLSKECRKVKLIESHFNQYLNLSKCSKIFEDNYEKTPL